MNTRIVTIVLATILGASLGALLGGFLLSQWAPGPADGGDKFGVNVVMAGVSGLLLGGVLGGVAGGTLGNLLTRRSAG